MKHPISAAMWQNELFHSRSVDETIDCAYAFASQLKPNDVVCLQGDLSVGKTHFVKGIARYLSIDEKIVQSPTYSLIHEYGGEPPLYHFDMYRLKSIEEALEIGVEDYFYDNGICLVEWSERIQSLIPNPHWLINMKTMPNNDRLLTFRRSH